MSSIIFCNSAINRDFVCYDTVGSRVPKHEEEGFSLAEILLPAVIRRRWRTWFFGRTVEEHVEAEGVDLIEALDCDDQPAVEVLPEIEDFNQVLDVDRRPRMRFQYAAFIATSCKIANPGIGIENNANRLVAARWLGDQMKARGVRERHIKKLLPVALELVFIPNEDELYAVQLRQTRAVRSRLEEHNSVWYSRDRPFVFNWFGRRHHRAPPTGP